MIEVDAERTAQERAEDARDLEVRMGLFSVGDPDTQDRLEAAREFVSSGLFSWEALDRAACPLECARDQYLRGHIEARYPELVAMQAQHPWGRVEYKWHDRRSFSAMHPWMMLRSIEEARMMLAQHDAHWREDLGAWLHTLNNASLPPEAKPEATWRRWFAVWTQDWPTHDDLRDFGVVHDSTQSLHLYRDGVSCLSLWNVAKDARHRVDLAHSRGEPRAKVVRHPMDGDGPLSQPVEISCGGVEQMVHIAKRWGLVLPSDVEARIAGHRVARGRERRERRTARPKQPSAQSSLPLEARP